MIFQSLLTRDPQTLELQPLIAGGAARDIAGQVDLHFQDPARRIAFRTAGL